MPLNIDIQQILLHMLNFAILFAVLYFVLYNPVKKFMDKREKYYNDMDEKATNSLSEAEKMKAEYEQKLSDIENEKKTILTETYSEATAQADKILSEAKDKAASIVSDAENKAIKEKQAIINSAGDDIREIAEAAAEKLLSFENEDAYNSFLDSLTSSDKEENN